MKMNLYLHVVCLTLLLVTPSHAGNAPASTDELLLLVTQSHEADKAINQQREAYFIKEKQLQEKLLADAKKELLVLQAESSRLELTFAAQDRLLKERQARVQQFMGSLQDLLGHLTTTAGSAQAIMEKAPTSAQFTERSAFFSELLKRKDDTISLPSVDDIERLWFELQREMTETAKIVMFKTRVITTDGRSTERDVVRIGAFNLLADGQYLAFDSGKKQVLELPRQPDAGFTSAAAQLQQASAGEMTTLAIDPTGASGGTFLLALINSPSLAERWHQGGTIGYIISVLGVIAAAIALWRLVYLSRVQNRINRQFSRTTPALDNPLGRILKVYRDLPVLDLDTLELKIAEAVLKERPALELGQTWLKLIGMVSPLLGLLGTVTGMIVTFQAITMHGNGDPQVMAEGIAIALVTTVLGLVVAIPTVFLHAIVADKVRTILNILEEQSAGVIAEHSELLLDKTQGRN